MAGQRKKKISPRLWEIDLARGIAMLLVIVFHFFYDLDFLGILSNEMYRGWWLVLQRTAALSFLGLAGGSVALAAGKQRDKIGQHCRKHGLQIFLWGMAVSLVTYLYLGEGFVVFGVLHLIGLGVFISPLFLRLPLFANAALAAVFYAAGKIAQGATTETMGLVWLGIRPASFFSVDYFPVFPWLGMIALGVGVGKLLFPNGKRRLVVPAATPQGLGWLKWLGTKTLFVYLIHQPVLIAILTVWKSI